MSYDSRKIKMQLKHTKNQFVQRMGPVIKLGVDDALGKVTGSVNYVYEYL